MADPIPDLRAQAVEAAHGKACRALIDNLTVSEGRWALIAGATPAAVVRAVMSEVGPIIERAALDRAERALRAHHDEWADDGGRCRYQCESSCDAADLVASLRDGEPGG